MTDSDRLKEKILTLVVELRRLDETLAKKIEKLMQDGHADAAAIRALPDWQGALSKNWETVFEQCDAVYDEMRTSFEARFRYGASMLLDEIWRHLGDPEPPRPSPTSYGHPDPEVKRRLEISRAYSHIRYGFRSEGAITKPSQLSYVADYLQTLADRLK
jgi:hypothetical protein